MQILKGITRASLQDTDFYATNMSNTLVLDMIQRATWFPQLLQNTDILAADRQLMPPLQMIDTLASGFYLQAQEFWELGILTIQHILEGKLTESLIDTVSELVISLIQAERANMTRIRLFSGKSAHLFDRNYSVMSQANLATTQRQIGIQQLTSGQSFANVQDNLIGQQGFDSERNQTQRQNTIARNSITVMKIDMESEKNDVNPPPLEAKINHASFIKQEATEPRNHTFLSLSVNRVLVNTILDLDMDRMMNR
ncbi:MAG: hypothetical protein EZS28_033013, partial [Streblomastix strix]